ncbi:hypothetical protein KY084_10850 [Stakelama sp. CBK3Z-3]|uniref:Adaptive response protein AidB N-terminal domain-containing protein n=1 Tax=Stakelama flava TaxID=2860338 RepID=A0ABS6XMD0_9SPHN|nr:hypothetical protein [Stakelama flava]
MSAYAPRTALETHDVTNQPDAFSGRNLYRCDRALSQAVAREAGDWLDTRLESLGALMGNEAMLEAGAAANRYSPELASFDRYGRRLDEVRFHPAYHLGRGSSGPPPCPCRVAQRLHAGRSGGDVPGQYDLCRHPCASPSAGCDPRLDRYADRRQL